MKKPNSLMQFFGALFSIIGTSFFMGGFLCKFELLATRTSSKGDAAADFCYIGLVLLIISVPLYFIALNREKQRKKLRENGIAVQGVVTNINHFIFVHWGSKSPYIIFFYYIYNNKTYTGTILTWQVPKLLSGDILTVYIDKINNYNYFTQI